MFTDDVKIWRTIESSSDVQRLQNDVDYLSSWSQGALMSFNTNKCVVLRLHPRQARDNNVQYQLNGEHLRISHLHFLVSYIDLLYAPTWHTHSKPGGRG